MGDDGQFLSTTAIGKYGIGGYRGGGRLWPLGLYDYNILTQIPGGHSPFAHYLYNAVTYLIFVFFLLGLLKDITRSKNFYAISYCCAILLTNCHLVRVNVEVIFAERMLVLLLSAFMYYYWKGKQTQKSICYIVGFFIACYATYCKEPVFVIFAVIAILNLTFGFGTAQDKLFSCFLLGNSIVYIVAYYFLVWKTSTSFYNQGRETMSLLRLIGQIFMEEKLLYPVFLLASIRSYFVILKRDYKHLFFDGLIFASAAYTCAYVLLHLCSEYYFFPSVILATPSFLYWLTNEKVNKKIVFCLMAIVLLATINDLGRTKYIIKNNQLHRKADMDGIKALSSRITANAKIIGIYDFSCSDHFYNIHVNHRFVLFGIFASYHLRKSITVEKSDNLSDVAETSIIIYPLENFACPLHGKFSRRMEEKDLFCIAQVDNTIIFTKKDALPVKIPFFYVFEPGATDEHLAFRIFGKANAGGTQMLTENSPLFKFKVTEKNKNIMVKFTLVLSNDTFGEIPVNLLKNSASNQLKTSSDVAVRILVNDKIYGICSIKKQKSPQKAEIFISRDLIKEDGTVSIKFLPLNPLKTEKELGRSNENTKRGLIFKDISIVDATID
ncbi:MAG: hypothetical protein LBF01_03925 [Bacteroidales bacterium]|nr:hypothetical protein [Bacteroidales bacterium]